MFENEYVFNRDLTKEYVYKILGKRIMIVGFGLFIISIILFFIETGTMKYAMLGCALVGIIYAIITPIRLVNVLEKNAKRLNNGKIEKTRVVFGDNIVMDEGKAHLEFEYSQIEKIVETKNLLALIIGNNASILVLKDGFVKGTQEEFMKFINEKIQK